MPHKEPSNEYPQHTFSWRNKALFIYIYICFCGDVRRIFILVSLVSSLAFGNNSVLHGFGVRTGSFKIILLPKSFVPRQFNRKVYIYM